MSELIDLDEPEPKVAGFSSRVVAFTLDYLLFTSLFFASMKAVFPEHRVLLNPHGMQWAGIWTFLFLAYQAWFSSEGRVTLGKRLLGLRVIALDGSPLTPGQAAVRSLGYLAGSVCGLGFLWVLGNGAGQGWHDLLAGSGVIEERAKSPGVRASIRAGACACLLLFGATWTWEYFVAADYYRNMTIAYSHVGFEELASLQEAHKIQTGRYADDLAQLAMVSGDPKGFMEDMSQLFDPRTGVTIKTTESAYRFEAVARDVRSTPVSYAGPRPG